MANLAISSKNYPYFSKAFCPRDYEKSYFATAPRGGSPMTEFQE